jgi:hypothetical protein
MKTFRQIKEGRGGLYICSDVADNERIPVGYLCVDIINRDIKRAIGELNIGESTPIRNGIYITRKS